MPTLVSSSPITKLPKTALTLIQGLPFRHLASGKVREIFDLGDYLLLVATDRISAFNAIMPNGIPGKGIILTQISLFWFEQTVQICNNHIPPNHSDLLNQYLKHHKELIPRSTIVKKLTPLPIEAIVRNYLTGSALKDYKATGFVFGQPIPPSKEFDPFPEPLFTPTTKVNFGNDAPLTEGETQKLLGRSAFSFVRKASIDLFNFASKKVKQSKLVLADTKFEFGKDSKGNLYLIDEILTPDSSRFWSEDSLISKNPITFDKQFLRDYLLTLKWNQNSPAPTLPQDIIDQTQKRYLQAYQKICE